MGSCPVTKRISSRTVSTEETNIHKVVAGARLLRVKVQNLVANKVPRERYCMRTSTIPTMSDREEDSGDIHQHTKKMKRISGWSMSRRVVEY